MAGQVPNDEITRKADADLSGATMRGRAVVLTAGNGCALAGANGKAIGILDNSPKLASAARIITGGTAKARAGAAYVVNARLASDADGKLVTAAADESVVGIAMEAATAADELREVRVTAGATSESA